MPFTELKKFITEDMSMSHIYQPVMLIELLENDGRATVKQIAQAILNHDPTQIDYYSEIVKNMVGKVLTKNRGITSKEADAYLLAGASDLSDAEKRELKTLCERMELLPDRILLYADDAEKVLDEIHKIGLHPVTSLVRRSSLEDVFLRLTGRTLVE